MAPAPYADARAAADGEVRGPSATGLHAVESNIPPDSAHYCHTYLVEVHPRFEATSTRELPLGRIIPSGVATARHQLCCPLLPAASVSRQTLRNHCTTTPTASRGTRLERLLRPNLTNNGTALGRFRSPLTNIGPFSIDVGGRCANFPPRLLRGVISEQ